MGDLSTASQSAAIRAIGRDRITTRTQCTTGTDHRKPPNPVGGYCGAWYDPDGDGQRVWRWPDGLWTFTSYCRDCSRAGAERSALEDDRAGVRAWAAELGAHASTVVDDYLARRSWDLPEGGYAAFRAWNAARGASDAAADEDTAPPHPQIPEAQKPRERARRRRSDVPTTGGST